MLIHFAFAIQKQRHVNSFDEFQRFIARIFQNNGVVFVERNFVENIADRFPFAGRDENIKIDIFELTELLNDQDRRFLAVTNAELHAHGSGAAPRRYDFLEIHIDSIIIMHPASQALFKESSKAQEDIAKFRELRQRLSQTKPF